MLTYIVRRLLLMIPTLIGITLVVFVVMAMSPGGVGGALVKGEMGGAEMDAEKTRALRAYYNRRYGLNQPFHIQYLRWLNQVSPIGFRTAVQLTYEQDTIDETMKVLKDLGLADSRNERERSFNVMQTIAAYADVDLLQTASKHAAKLLNPKEALELFALVDAQVPDKLPGELEKLLKEKDKAKAQEQVLKALSDEFEGINKVHFHRPVIKWPDLGDSIAKGRPVTQLYSEALPITLLLNLITTPIVYLIAIAMGVYAARHRGKAIDIVSGVVLLGFYSIPVIWTGVMLIGFLANRDILQLFPTNGISSTTAAEMAFLPAWGADGFERGWLLDRIWHLILPVICLTYGSFAYLSKIVRSSLLENLSADYVRTARSKGVDQNVVLWQHAFRNSLMPLITFAAYLLPGLIAGSLIVEQIFSIPGMGRLTIEAVQARDRELVLAGALVGGLLGMFSILIADLLYAVADPRVSFD